MSDAHDCLDGVISEIARFIIRAGQMHHCMQHSPRYSRTRLSSESQSQESPSQKGAAALCFGLTVACNSILDHKEAAAADPQAELRYCHY